VSDAETTRKLRDELLRETFGWCRARSSFYEERFAGVEEFSGLDDLHRLPVLFRQDVVDNHEGLCCDPSLPTAVQHTTGTTGQFLQLHRSAAEQSFIWEFFSAQLAVDDPVGPRTLCLNLINPYHGGMINVPSRTYMLSAGVFDPPQAQQARGLLERSYKFPDVEPRVSTLSGTERMVMALTAYLMADGFDLANSSVRSIRLFGGHVPASRKHLLANLWQAQIRDLYSLTELFGGAYECGIGGPWVFDPHVVPEVVHPKTLEPLTEGTGVLLMTGLYPFVQMMPLVRYYTGDIVEIVKGPDSPGGLQVQYMGRMPRSILDTSGAVVEPLLLSGPLYEALIEIPDIAVSPRFLELPQSTGMELTGDLHYGVDHEPATGDEPERITVRLGLRYAPWMYADRVAQVVDQLVARLFAQHPALERRCADQSLIFRVLPLHADAVPIYDSK